MNNSTDTKATTMRLSYAHFLHLTFMCLHLLFPITGTPGVADTTVYKNLD